MRSEAKPRTADTDATLPGGLLLGSVPPGPKTPQSRSNGPAQMQKPQDLTDASQRNGLEPFPKTLVSSALEYCTSAHRNPQDGGRSPPKQQELTVQTHKREASLVTGCYLPHPTFYLERNIVIKTM